MSFEKDYKSSSSFIDQSEMQRLRLKPGPKKAIEPRSEKIRCRLTKNESTQVSDHCKKHGLKLAPLIRKSLLGAILRPADRERQLTQDILRTLEISSLNEGQKKALKRDLKVVFKRYSLFVLLILVAVSVSVLSEPTVAKYILHLFSDPGGIVFTGHNACLLHYGETGCEMVPK